MIIAEKIFQSNFNGLKIRGITQVGIKSERVNL